MKVLARSAALAVSSLLPLALIAGCGDDRAEAGNGDGKLKVGVFLPGSISDTGFMQSAYLGYQRLQAALGDEVDLSYVERVEAADYEQALVRFASASDLVVSVGGQTDADVRKVAPQFPEVTFVEIGGPADAVPLANLAYYDPQQAEAEFLSGVVSAASSQKGAVGFVGGVELPAIVNAAKAYANGVAFAGTGAEVLAPQYVGDFNDPAKAKQAAAADFGAGADVLGQIVNLGKQGIEQAAKESGARMVGGPIPGDCTDSAYVGYVKTDIGAELEYAVHAVLDGTWKAEQVRFGLTSDNGGTDFVLCTKDDAVAALLAKAKSELASGAVTAY
ncbi:MULTISPECIES: BMP family ABC transporter substrate-binding protein [Actinoplanes]|uniref:BMP family ABC transporter substrate-binding protein n=1 Tax=Actinoplanes TaxID=1865 RepID=UPI0005F2F75C|nr:MULTISPECIES: BMP family ABC transporter substrate-binding protein [Actinoplanes]GLY02129.1 BMP family ABC transporter substrate-binding protein [Actinoplanes sp. NBRC 101535]